MTIVQFLFGGTCVMCSVYVSYCFYKNYRNESEQQTKKGRSLVLFSSEESVMCKTHLMLGNPCNRIHCPVRTINELRKAILSAKHSLDVCVYFLTHPSLIDAIVEVFHKDVPVRIITDADMSDNTSSTEHIYKMRKLGIRLRTKQSFYYMHHKFAVIDKRILITGSTNWTKNGFFGNFENIIITNQPDLAKPFAEEFERLWIIFDNLPNTNGLENPKKKSSRNC